MKRVLVGLFVAGALAAVAFAAVAAASESVVLGSKKYDAPAGSGWGTAHPAKIFNGGDPSGLVTGIHWSHWGQATATGIGLNAIYKPAGGFYAKKVHIQLRAYDEGYCPGSAALAYRKLKAREPSKPGGSDGKWFKWGGTGSIC